MTNDLECVKFSAETAHGGTIVLLHYPESGYLLRYHGAIAWRENPTAPYPTPSKPAIARDWSQEKPRLHELYVNTGMKHLKAINRTIEELSNFSNVNMWDIIHVMCEERKNLILYNTAYRDAAARLMAGIEPVEDDFSQDEVKEGPS